MFPISRLDELKREYIKDICDMTLDNMYNGKNETEEDIEEILKRLENEEAFTDHDLTLILDMIDVWGDCEPMYTEIFVRNLQEQLRLGGTI